MEYKYQIRQIKDIKKVDYAFAPWDIAKDDYKKSDYKKVYQGTYEFDTEEFERKYNGWDATAAILEKLFSKFNRDDRPEDFKGHSLSVSDVIVLNNVPYYCDSCGWQRL